MLLRGLLGTIFRCLMLLLSLRSYFHVGLHLPQCTIVFSSSKWKHIIRTAVQLFLKKKGSFFIWKSTVSTSLFVGPVCQYTFNFKDDRLSLWHISLFPALHQVGRTCNTQGTQNVVENWTKTICPIAKCKPFVAWGRTAACQRTATLHNS